MNSELLSVEKFTNVAMMGFLTIIGGTAEKTTWNAPFPAMYLTELSMHARNVNRLRVLH